MATPVETPKLGNTVEECLVAKWRKHKGERVAKGEVVLDIETDKAAFEVAAPVSGTLLETFFPEGALAPVFENLFVIGEPGEDIEAFRPRGGQTAGEDGQKGVESDGSPGSFAVESAPGTRAATGGTPAPGSQAFSPRARRFADAHGFHPTSVEGSGPGGRVIEEDLRNLYQSAPRVSPLARRLMAEGAEVRGESPAADGRILSSDLGPPPTPLSNIRKKIASRMRESLATTAQYTLHSSADAAGLLALRSKIKASRATDISIGDLVAYCAIQAVLEFPEINVELIEDRTYRHSSIHLGFACDTPRGLLVPVVRDAHRLSIQELSVRMRTLATEAVNGNISVDDLSGATFTVSNLGALGIESFTPLLNPPQVAILGVDAIQVKPVRRDDRIDFVDCIGLSLTCDHQVIDGAPGARFLGVLKSKIENVESLCTI